MTRQRAFARTGTSPRFEHAAFLTAMIVGGLSYANAIPCVIAEEAERFEGAPIEVSARIRPGRALTSGQGDADDYNDGPNGKAEFLLQTTFQSASDGPETRWFEQEVDVAENPIVPFDEVGWRKIECHGRSQLDVNAVLTEIDITTSEAIAIGIGAALISAPLSPVLGVFIGAAATLVTSLPGNDSFGGANATVPTNGAVTLRFRGPDGAADLPIEGSTASVPGAARTDFPDPVAEPPMVSTPTPEERAEQLFGPLENALQLSRQASYESGLGGEAAESQIADVRRTLGGAVLKLGEIAATLAVETANEPDSLKIGAELIASGRSAATEGNWDDALAHYRTAFASAAPPDQAQESEIPSELPQRVALLPEFVATTPLRTIAVEGYVTGLSPGAAVEDVELGQLPISINVGPPVVRHERTFGFAVEIGDVALDAGTPLEVTLPVTARLTTGEVAQGGLTLIIYPRPQDGSEER